VDQELNRAIDWLKSEGISKVILTGDFHLSTQMIGADTSDFYPALEDAKVGFRISNEWSKTARRLDSEFEVSVGFVNGKRCLGGMLELLTHCHYVVSVDDARLGMPEVTVPVVPGMEGCHWPLRKAQPGDWPQVMALLLSGAPVKAKDAMGWLIDYAAPLDEALQKAWKLVTNGDHELKRRALDKGALSGIPKDVAGLPPPDSPANAAAREAIAKCIQDACGATLADALDIQSKHSGDFMLSKACQSGAVGAEYTKTMKV
jgi:enoyl-CoA hydratase/carnithine racemase